MNLPTSERKRRWQAVESCDFRAAGTFVFARKYEGVYCSPICGKRPVNENDVEFFDSPETARRHGYTPCPACHPDQAGWLVGAALWW